MNETGPNAANKKLTFAYWVLTVIVVVSQGMSGLGDVVKAQPLLEGVTALGYPEYILWIIGPAKLIGVVVLAGPKLPILKEWAYAGFTIDFLGAFASHLFNGDTMELFPPLILLGILLAGYKLRPADRRPQLVPADDGDAPSAG